MSARQDTSATIDNLRHDLQSLRGDISRLADEIPTMLSEVKEESLDAARRRIKRMKQEIDLSLAHIRDTRRQAVQAVGDVADTLTEGVERSLSMHPVATLALAVGIGCLIGASLRR